MPMSPPAPRPFGAHLNMAWWKPLPLVPGLLVLFLGMQVASHVADNLVTSNLNTTLAAGEAPVFERSVGAGGPSYLILAAVNVAVVGVVWWRERSQKADVQ